jgi:hypothetical protein
MLIKSPSSVVITNGVKGCRPKSSSSLLVIISLSKPFGLQGFSDSGHDQCLTWQFLCFGGSVDPFQKVVLEIENSTGVLPLAGGAFPAFDMKASAAFSVSAVCFEGLFVIAIGYPFYNRSDIFSIYTASIKSVGFGSGNNS